MDIDAVVFDYDGTLVHLNIDFGVMRRRVDGLLDAYSLLPGAFKGLFTLEMIDKASRILSRQDSAAGRSFFRRAMELVTEEEVEAAKRGRILPGILGTLSALRGRGIKVGIITRNCEQAVRIAFPRVEEICDAFVPRDDAPRVKPHPAHLRLAMRRMGVHGVGRCLVVGDHVLDVEAGRKIGMKTAGVLTGHTTREQFIEAKADLVLRDATEVLSYVLKGESALRDRFLQSGKLNVRILSRLLRQYAVSDHRVIIGPQVGEDTAAIDMGDKVLVVTTDPITFATDEIGYYGVVVNANDIATTGAQPRWFTVDILLPEHRTDETMVDRIFRQIHQACQEFGISLIGGHTEITCGLDRPILVGQMMGEVGKDEFVTTSGAQVGDDILLSKGICVEGTAIIAREKGEELISRGISRSQIERARNFLYDPGISVLREARIAREAGRVHSMHDVTEGGLANGLHEIAMTANVEIGVEKTEIPILEESRVICEAFGLDPLGVIASGALLITAAPAEAGKIVEAASREGVAIHKIGRVNRGEPSVFLLTSEGKEPLPYFSRDEVVRILEQPSSLVLQGG